MLVSIITSVYNAGPYLQEAIDSILRQTHEEFEWIIFDDASDDKTNEILRSITDKRIIITRNNERLGLTKNLNTALNIAKGEYILRMDGDDIALPGRIEKQVRYMEDNRDVLLSGGSMICFGESDALRRAATDFETLKIRLIYNSVISHPTFIFRREVLDNYNIYYDEKLPFAQDYGFTYSVSKRGKITNVSDVLMKYRIHGRQISKENAQMQNICANRTRIRILNDLGIYLSREDEISWCDFCSNYYNIESKARLDSIFNTIEMIIAANFKIAFFDQIILEQLLLSKFNNYKSLCEKNDSNNSGVAIKNKFQRIMQVMYVWDDIPELRIRNYLERIGVQVIGIYGASFLGEYICRKLRRLNIEVRCFADTFPENSYLFAEEKVMTSRDVLPFVDGVINTVIGHSEEIRGILNNEGKKIVIDIEEMTYQM